jgi:hypothetical protein
MPIDENAMAARGCPVDLFTAVTRALGDRWVTPAQFNALVSILAEIHAHNERVNNGQ